MKSMFLKSFVAFGLASVLAVGGSATGFVRNGLFIKATAISHINEPKIEIGSTIVSRREFIKKAHHPLAEWIYQL